MKEFELPKPLFAIKDDALVNKVPVPVIKVNGLVSKV